MTKLWLLGLVLFCIVCVSADVERTLTYNITELPMSGNTTFNFTLVENATVFYELIQGDGWSNLSFPTNTTIAVNNTETTLQIDYALPFFADYVEDHTIFENIIAITNDLNNNVVALFLSFDILHPFGNTTSPWMIIKNEGQLIEITTFTTKSYNKKHKVTVFGNVNRTVNVSCGKYISCPTSVFINTSEQEEFEAEIDIPLGEPSGEYDSHITLASGNKTGKIKFKIIIKDDKVLRFFVWNESCFDNETALADCYRAQAIFNAEIVNALLEQCDKEETINETIKYVEIGNIDPELLEANKDLRGKYTDLTQEYTVLSVQFQNCSARRAILEGTVPEEIRKLGDETLLTKNRLIENAKQDAEDARLKNRKALTTALASVFFVLIGFLLVGLYLQSQLTITRFPVWILIILIALFGLAWFIAGFVLRGGTV